MVNGDGCRMTIVFQGCSLNCTGCFSKELQDFSGGRYISAQKFAHMIAEEYEEARLLDGITLSGGNPQEQEDLATFLRALRPLLPKEATIWMWTGFTMEEIQNNMLLKNHLQFLDVIVTGKFIESLKIENPYYGSSNQEI